MNYLLSFLNFLAVKTNKSEFLRNIATLTKGTFFAQLISFFTAPILYRLYSKNDYGTFGLYMAIVGVLSTFSTLQYSQTILLERDDHNAKKAMRLIRYINILFTLFVTLVVFILKIFLNQNNLILQLGIWIYLIPLSIFFTGQSEIFRIWANRKNEFKIMSWNSIINALMIPVFSISLGFLISGEIGLFAGLLASQIFSSLYLFFYLTSKYDLNINRFSIRMLFLYAIRNRNHPLYNLPSVFLNRFIGQMPVFMFTRYAGIEMVAVYNLSIRMLSLPSTMLSNAIGEVFRQRATNDYHEFGSARPILKKTFYALLIISIIPVLIILFFGPQLFSFFFGETWYEAGLVSQVLMPYFCFQLIVSPLTYLYFIANRLKENLIIHIYIFLSTYMIFHFGFLLGFGSLSILLLYSVNYCFIFVFYFIRSFQFSENKLWENSRKS
jgi:teichuronic acid exporter